MSDKKPTTKSPATKSKIKLPEFKSMLLVEGVFIDNPSNPVKNFIGIPINETCPFIELVFDPEKKILGIVSKHKKNQFHFVPRLDGNGMPKPNSNKVMQQTQPFAQERLLLETYHEYYLRTPEEIDAFLNMYVINTDFNWKSFLK